MLSPWLLEISQERGIYGTELANAKNRGWFSFFDSQSLNIYQDILFNERSGHSKFDPHKFNSLFMGKPPPNIKNLKNGTA